MNTSICQRPGCVNEQPVHRDHTWTQPVPARVGRHDGNVYVYAMSDDDRAKFPEDEIFLALYPGDLSTELEGEAKMTVSQAEVLVAQLQAAIAFTRTVKG